ncbi:MAG TPA: DUF4386 domain-containing protein [Bacteroidales bacterium]|nr:DUF4386 domain-containing protein [Bacteroidales bacterium]
MTTTNRISLHSAAIIAGIGLLVSLFAAPFAELFALPKLIVPFQPAETANNILHNQTLFSGALIAYLITFISDIVIAWALFILLRPVHRDLSLLTALFRLVYTVIAIIALNNLVTAFQLITTPDYLSIFSQDQVNNQAMVSLRAFRNHWYFGIVFFGIHLMLLGFLSIRSGYIPKVFGILLMIAGMGYFLTSLRPYIMPNVNLDFAKYTYYGEVLFMLWLLIRGYKIREVK